MEVLWVQGPNPLGLHKQGKVSLYNMLLTKAMQKEAMKGCCINERRGHLV